MELDTSMLAVMRESGHTLALHIASIYNPASAAITCASGLVVILTWALAKLPRRITYRPQSCTRVLRSEVPDLEMSYKGKELGDPHLLALELRYRGRSDLRRSSFEDGRPFRIDIGTPVMGVIAADLRRGDLGELRVASSGNELTFGPGLLRRREVVRLVVLLDGACGSLTHKSRPPDVLVWRRASADASHSRWPLKKAVTWASVFFVLYYLATSPAGAGAVVQGLLNWLQSTGNSIAQFLNSVKV